MKVFVVLIALAALLGTSSHSRATTKKTHAADSTKTMAAKTVYTCTMHPEVTSSKPGKCPKCKMDLVKREVKMPAGKKQAAAKATPALAADSYACPMHADVTSDKPGTCPKCKMDLVKKKS